MDGWVGGFWVGGWMDGNCKLESLHVSQGRENDAWRYLDFYRSRVVNFFVIREDRDRP